MLPIPDLMRKMWKKSVFRIGISILSILCLYDFTILYFATLQQTPKQTLLIFDLEQSK